MSTTDARPDDDAVTRAARRQVTDDERTASRRRSISLPQAWGEFVRHPSPWILGAFWVACLAARLVAGDYRWSDAVLPLVVVALFPFVEWTVHVVVLHWRPRHVGPLTVDSLLSRKHRAHHADPRDLPLVFIPWPVLCWLVPLDAVLALLAVPRTGLALTLLLTVATLGVLYEWTHYLIHSDYRPRSRAYRAVWRNHRLHHYKNEHYWFTVTTTATADRLLGTYPDPATVERSETARSLPGARTSR